MGVLTIKRAKKSIKQSKQTINIYVLQFKTMVIITSCFFFNHMNVKEFKPKIHLIKF
jgi:hypothetical protein